MVEERDVEMMMAMTEKDWVAFGKYMDIVDADTKRAIAYNIRCYDRFFTFPDDAPLEYIDVVKRAAGVND